MMMSPESWRKSIGPQLERIFRYGKSQHLWVAYHSCGSIRDIIQGNCPGMDPSELKREFGKSISFMGGVDTQELLPLGSVQDIQREVDNLIGIMASGGGYTLAASHTIPPETPLDNFFAMYRVAGVNREMISDRAGDIRRRLSQQEVME